MLVPAAEKSIPVIRQKLLAGGMAEWELGDTLDLIERIQRLKKSKNAVILGHNYMTPAVFHGVSDYVGDSLALSYAARDAQADIILFNGVHFMAETAKILNPSAKVLIADPEAGCSLAESITAADVRGLRELYPGVPVVTYINCSAAVKAETDICCTSANALRVVESLAEETVLLLPDEFLTRNVALQSRKKIIGWGGSCMVHKMYRPEDIRFTRRHFPGLVVITHPECPPDVTREADFSGSTSQMAGFIADSGAKNILLLTECSMGDNLRAAFPDRVFVSTCQTCPHMKKISLSKVLRALETETHAIELDRQIIDRARVSIDAMLGLGK